MFSALLAASTLSIDTVINAIPLLIAVGGPIAAFWFKIRVVINAATKHSQLLPELSKAVISLEGAAERLTDRISAVETKIDNIGQLIQHQEEIDRRLSDHNERIIFLERLSIKQNH